MVHLAKGQRKAMYEEWVLGYIIYQSKSYGCAFEHIIRIKGNV